MRLTAGLGQPHFFFKNKEEHKRQDNTMHVVTSLDISDTHNIPSTSGEKVQRWLQQDIVWSVWWMMTGRALNYQLRGNTRPDATFLKIVSKIIVMTTLLEVSSLLLWWKTLNLGFSTGKCLINTHGHLLQAPTPITKRLEMFHVLHIHSQSSYFTVVYLADTICVEDLTQTV